MMCAHEPLVCYSLPCCAQGLASPTGSGLPPESGTETHFNRQALNFDRALPGPPLSAVPSLPRLLGFAGARLRFPSPTQSKVLVFSASVLVSAILATLHHSRQHVWLHVSGQCGAALRAAAYIARLAVQAPYPS